MPHSFFSALRLAGMNIGLILITMAVLVWMVIVAWRVLLAFCAATLIILIGAYVGLAKRLGVKSSPLTEDQRLAARALGVSLASALTIDVGGRYGGQRRQMRAIEARRRNP